MSWDSRSQASVDRIMALMLGGREEEARALVSADPESGDFFVGVMRGAAAMARWVARARRERSLTVDQVIAQWSRDGEARQGPDWPA